MLNEQGDNIDIHNENGETLLSVAASEMSYNKVCFLLSVGADPNAVDYECAVPLMKACYNRNAPSNMRQAIIRELLEAGANSVAFDAKWNSVHR